jgi:hypothetical protein
VYSKLYLPGFPAFLVQIVTLIHDNLFNIDRNSFYPSLNLLLRHILLVLNPSGL